MRTLFIAAALSLAGGMAFAQDMSAQDFVNEAASGGLFEVQSSQLALERGQADAVKTFAQQMVTDHTANNQELQTTAQAEGLTVPTEITGPNAENLQAVQAAEGDGFDSVYAARQTAAHEAAVKLYQGYAESGDNAALVAYAKKSLPVLEQHLEHAKALPGQ